MVWFRENNPSPLQRLPLGTSPEAPRKGHFYCPVSGDKGQLGAQKGTGGMS